MNSQKSIYQESVCSWLRNLANGDEAAQDRAFKKYSGKLIGVVRNRMHGLNKVPYDEEDVCMSAWASFFNGIEEKKFFFSSEEDLWGMLIVIAQRKACAERRRQITKKRGGYAMILRPVDVKEETDLFQDAAGREPSPEVIELTADLVDELLRIFPDETEKEDEARTGQVLRLKLSGCSNAKIAKTLNVTSRTVINHLERIRTKIAVVRGLEYIFDNLFDNAPLQLLADGVNISVDTAQSVVAEAFKLWERQISTDAELRRSRLLQAAVTSPSEFAVKYSADDPDVRDAFASARCVATEWIKLVKTNPKWYGSLRKLIPEAASMAVVGGGL